MGVDAGLSIYDVTITPRPRSSRGVTTFVITRTYQTVTILYYYNGV